MPAGAAAAAEPQATQRQVHVVVDDHQRSGVETGERKHAADRFAAAVHVGLRQREQAAAPADAAVADAGAVPLLAEA